MIWVDAQLPPRIAGWIRESLGHQAMAIRDLGLRDAEDQEIFERGRDEEAIILTKDRDFSEIVARHGSPTAVIWLRCGNSSEMRLKEIQEDHLDEALGFLSSGEELVEIR